MKHRAWLLAAFAAAGVILLTACTSSEEEIAQEVKTDSSIDAGARANGTSAQPDAAQPDVSQDAGMGDVSGGQVQTEAPGEAASAQTGSGTTEAVQTEAPQGGAGEPASEDIWSGTYASEQETVTISLIDAKSFSFSFANSGIASVAEVDGNTAVYKGDDHHNVVFSMNEGVLNITVSSEEDYDASASPLNGTYVRQN